jgi:probable phosphoglycerate mutase
VSGQGRNVPINQKGRDQAAELVNEMKGIHLDIIYTSPLIRAFETGKMVADDKKCELVEIDNLKECNFGVAEGVLRTDINTEDYDKHIGINPDFAFECGEKQFDAAKRAFEVLKDLAENSKYTNIGISTHGGIIRFVLSNFLDTPTGFGVKNAKPYHLIYENGKFEILD